jgi:hypothetical protein
MSRHVLAVGMAALLAIGPTLVGARTSTPAPAKAAPAKADDAHRRDDIAKHRQMARAHEEAARCLESGEKEGVCQEKLRAACAGIAVGRFCGMRHAH